jgi:hypothetical protein
MVRSRKNKETTVTSNPFDEQGPNALAEPTADTPVENTDGLTDLEDAEADAQSETDFDVDTPDASEVDEPEAPAAEGEGKPAAKAKPASTRPPVPEGFISPVAFAKELTKHLRAKGKLGEADEIAPQMVYSYLKNANKAGSKNPWPSYSEGGRDNLLKLQESLDWWDAKDARVAERKTNKAEKEKAKADKAAAKANETAPEAAAEPVVEAE